MILLGKLTLFIICWMIVAIFVGLAVGAFIHQGRGGRDEDV